MLRIFADGVPCHVIRVSPSNSALVGSVFVLTHTIMVLEDLVSF